MARTQPIELEVGVWYLPGAVNTFVVRAPGDRSLLVDTGQDKDYARRLLKASREELQLEPVAIVNTHAHSDHFGGNSWLLQRLPGARVYAPAGSVSVITDPELQATGLFYGASPIPELRQKWTMAPASPVHVPLEAGEHEVEGVQIEFIDAAGHDRSQLALRIGEVLIAADGLFGEALLSKYPLPFSHDPGAQTDSARRLGEVAAKVAVPGHGDPAAPSALAQLNVTALERVRSAVLEALEPAGDIATVLERVCTQLDIVMTDPVRYLLNSSTMAAWLGHLKRSGQAECLVEGGRLVWRRRQLPYGDA